MPQPVSTIWYYGSSAVGGTTFGSIGTIAPTPATTATRWNVNRNNPPLFSEMNYGAIVIRTSTQWQSTPSGSAPNQNTAGTGVGNCFAFNTPFNGEFLSGDWLITGSIIGTVQTATRTGRFVYRLWKSPSITGQNASLLTTGFINSSIATISNITTPVVTTASTTIENINLHNEYLFLQIYWSILTSPGGGTANNNTTQGIYIGQNFSSILPPPFVSHNTSKMEWITDEFY